MLNQLENLEQQTAIIRKIGSDTTKITLENQPKKLVIHVAGRIFLIAPESIQYCTADGNYTNIILDNGDRLLASYPLKTYYEKLKPFGFQRIHKSTLVAFDSIYKINNDSVQTINGEVLALSRRKRKELLTVVESHYGSAD